MNYRRIYDNLIQKGLTRSQIEGYYEKHHIVPKCLGGTDELSNMVKLYPEEHYVAHLILVKIHCTNYKLIYAALRMTIHPNQKRTTNKLYGWLRRRACKYHPMKNASIREAVSISTKERWKNPDYRKEMSLCVTGELNPMFGKKGKASPGYGMITANNGIICKRFKPNEVPEGWVRGYLNMKGASHPMYGRKHSDETRAKLREAVAKRKPKKSTDLLPQTSCDAEQHLPSEE